MAGFFIQDIVRGVEGVAFAVGVDQLFDAAQGGVAVVGDAAAVGGGFADEAVVGGSNRLLLLPCKASAKVKRPFMKKH